MAQPNPSTRCQSRLRGCTSLAVLLAALVFAVRLLLPDAVGEQVRRSFTGILQEHYAGLKVTVTSGRYDPQRGVLLTGIEIRDPSLPRSASPLASIDQVLVETHLDLGSLTEGKAPVAAERIVVRGVTANLWSTDDQHWSLEQLFPPPKMGPGCPVIIIDGLRLRLCKSSDERSPALELNQLRVNLRQHHDAEQGTSREFNIRGTGGFIESLDIAGKLDAQNNLLIKGRAKNLNVDGRVYQRLPESLVELASKIRGLEAVADVEWVVSGPLDQCAENWGLALRVHQGRFSDPRLPAPLEDISGRAKISPRGVHLENAAFTLNGSQCQVKGSLAEPTWPTKTQLQLSAWKLVLNDSLMQALPAKGRELDAKLKPRGIIDWHGYAAYDGTRWDLDGDITCHNMSIRLDKFPYPLEEITGRVSYRQDVASATNLACRAGGLQLTTSFQVAPPGSTADFWIDIQGTGAVSVDDTLIKALTPLDEETTKLESFVRELAPAGAVRLERARIGRLPDGQLTKQIDLEVIDGRLRYDKFPYPLFEVRGRISVDNHLVTLSQFQAQNNGGAHIQCEGVWRGIPELRAGELDLSFQGFGIPLDDGLRSALPPATRQTWDSLGPEGILEQLQVRIEHSPRDDAPKLTIVAQQWNSPGSHRREVSITPTALPYRLNITRGMFTMRDEIITISDVDGYHGSSRVTAEGTCRRRTDGRWQLDVNLLNGSRLRPDAELISALPEDIRGSFAKLQLREPVSLRGATQLILPNESDPSPIFSWNVLLQLEGNRIGDTGPVHAIRGEVLVSGSASNNGTSAEGSVRIDSLHVNELQLTNIVGPFSIEGANLRLGQPAAQDDPTSPLIPIRGNVFAGQLDLTGEVFLTSGQFDVGLRLDDADLPTLLSELGQAQADMKGRFGGEVRLEGILGAGNLLRGTGVANLREANLYQLPLVVQLFNQLSLKPAEDAAFTAGETRFNLDGDLLTLNDLKLWGDLVVLHGGGTINRSRELDLSFNTRVSPQSVWGKMVRPLRSQKYTLWTIYVRGSISDPRIERRALDAVGETLERLFPVMDLDTASTSTGTRPSVSTASRRSGTSRPPNQ